MEETLWVAKSWVSSLFGVPTLGFNIWVGQVLALFVWVRQTLMFLKPESKGPNGFKISGLNPPLGPNKGQATFWNFRWHIYIIKGSRIFKGASLFSASKFERAFLLVDFSNVSRTYILFGTLRLLVGLANLHSDSTRGCQTFSWRAQNVSRGRPVTKG